MLPTLIADEYNAELAKAVAARYAEAYRVAKNYVGLNKTTQALAIVAWALCGSLDLQGRDGWLIGGCVAAVIYLLGTLVGALGHVLSSTLDTAVNSSPYLTGADRAAMMERTHTAAGQYPKNLQSTPTDRFSAASWECRCGRSNPWSASACESCGTPYPT